MLFDKIKENWILIISGLVVISFLFIKNNDFLAKGSNPIDTTVSLDNSKAEESKDTDVVIVDIKGEIKYPGIYEVDPNSRVNDVVVLAGGFSDNANQMFVNLAQKVQDEMSIIIPSIDEVQESISSTSEGSNDKISINYATKEEIESLNGIGPSKAAAIIQYRDEHGMFQKVEDLLEVSGIGEKTLESLKDYIQIP